MLLKLRCDVKGLLFGLVFIYLRKKEKKKKRFGFVLGESAVGDVRQPSSGNTKHDQQPTLLSFFGF